MKLVLALIFSLFFSNWARASVVVPSVNQATGSLSGRIVFTSGGHGWVKFANWSLQRGILVEMNEDYGNMDQDALFAYYCFNAGATVVPLRPIGYQTNEVVLDNSSAGVVFSGNWINDTSSTVYYGPVGGIRLRTAMSSATETATATYTPNIPRADFYPVYVWAPHGADRTNQLYKILHSGGESPVRVPHHMVGNGWVYVGTYHFNSGSNPENGAVVVSNLQPSPAGTVVVADAVRFGNGMSNSGSNYPREDEGGRWWIQNSLGQGQSTNIYSFPADPADIEDRKSRPRMCAEMNRESAGSINKRVYISFHSNATTGNTNTATARGSLALYHTVNPTPNQQRLAVLMGGEVTTNMVSMNSRLEYPWHNRGSGITFSGPSYHEIDNTNFNGEMSGTIVEVAFHDQVQDGPLMRDPKVRNWVARASYHGVLKYMNQFDAAPLVYLPEPPTNLRAIASTNNAIALTWNRPVNIMNSGNPTGYVVYRSTNGFGFGNPVTVSGVNSTNFTVSGLAPGLDYYFRITAVNAGGESMPSETAGCRTPSTAFASKVLFVNGFTRFDRTLNLRQTPTVLNWSPPGASGTMERVMPRFANSFDYVVQHGKAIAAAGLLPFDSCQRAAVLSGHVPLTNYNIVIWAAGQEATNAIPVAAQTLLANFASNGGHLFVSGADVVSSLGRSAAANGDKLFLQNYLRATLGPDSNSNSQTRVFAPVGSSIFAGLGGTSVDDGRKGTYCVQHPDVLLPSGPGSTAAMNYSGGIGGNAAIQYDGSEGGGRVVLCGFPFETIVDAAPRTDYMKKILRFFAQTPKFYSATILGSQVALGFAAEPGYSYIIETSNDLVSWSATSTNLNLSGHIEWSESLSPGNRYYRVRW
ncbi:MAG: fibronectin type III domain-containing protein [Verrucomicrobia bacterium]|nr:fibronectin type III domain-containing protein [Verrucomicrobiota bacterium]